MFLEGFFVGVQIRGGRFSHGKFQLGESHSTL
jgi:hypothetical protein